MQPIGLFGGTFDPLHNGHLRLAADAMRALGLREVRLLPAGDPYQKGRAPLANGTHRLAMVQAAVADIPGLVADGRELARTGPTYTIDTLRDLRADARFAGVPLVWLIGADAFADLPRWHAWQSLFDMTHFAVFGRGGVASGLAADFAHFAEPRKCAPESDWQGRLAGNVIEMTLPAMTISSTQVRATIMGGQRFDHLLPPAVCEYISRCGLYRSPPQPL
jgi:nicotinate-nucleotide adenylyltransferase